MTSNMVQSTVNKVAVSYIITYSSPYQVQIHPHYLYNQNNLDKHFLLIGLSMQHILSGKPVYSDLIIR